MALSRRDFVVSTGVAVTSAAPGLLHAQQTGRRELVQVGVAAGRTADPVQLLLAQQVALKAKGATASEAARLQKLAESASTALGGSNLAEYQRQIVDVPFFREIGLTAEVDKAVRSGALIPVVRGFTEIYRPETPSLMDTVVTKIGVHVRNASQVDSSRMLAAAAYALGFNGVKGISIPKLLGGAPKTFKDGVLALWESSGTAAGLQSKATEMLAPLLTFSEGQVLEAGKLAKQLKAPGLEAGRDTFSLELTPTLQNIKAGAAVLDATLALFGEGSRQLRQNISRGVQATQSAVQLYQAVSALAVASGFGTIIAMSGMLSGAGGVSALSGLFGGAQGGGEGESAVLGAINQLRKEIRSEFNRVNEKLNRILQQLDQVLDGINGLRGQIDLALDLLRHNNEQVSRMLERMNETAFAQIEEKFDQEQSDCRRRIDERDFTKDSVNHCRTRMAHFSTRLSLVPFQNAGAEDVLLNKFRQSPSPSSYWSAAKAFRDVAVKSGLPVAGSPAYEPAFVAIAKVFFEMKTQFSSMYVVEQDTQAAVVRKSLIAHLDFKRSLRDGRFATFIHTRYQRLVDELQNQCVDNLDAALSKVVGNDKGEPGRGQIMFVNPGGAPSAGTYVLVRPNEMTVDGPISPTYMSCLQGNCSGLRVLVEIVSLKIGSAEPVNESTFLYGFDDVVLEFVIKYDGASLHAREKISLSPPLHTGSVDAAKLAKMRADPVYALSVFGPLQPLKDRVIALLQSAIGTMRRLQVQAIFDAPQSVPYRDAWRQMLGSPELGGNDATMRLPAIPQLERLGDFARAYCYLNYPDATAASDALQNLFYGTDRFRLPDAEVMRSILKSFSDASVQVSAALPWKTFRARANALTFAMGEAAVSDSERGLPFEIYSAMRNFERAFPTTS